ncbi:MAG: glutamine-hydrolyzing carbamoyl-phosphate synthase small subunit [Bacteroidota bacterium]|jgi:carbamoyl-phosphate synthase small subunit
MRKEIGLGRPAVLQLADGTRFEGYAVGKVGMSSGEIAFNTGMYGYQEIFTDPSYHRQILVMATAHIGNYGVSEGEAESGKVQLAGLVCNEFSAVASRIGEQVESLEVDLMRNDIVGIAGVDTRKLVRHIRENGAMNAVVSSVDQDVEVLQQVLESTPSMEGLGLSAEVTCSQAYDLVPEGAEPSFRIAVMDYGVKQNILRCLLDRGAVLRVFPSFTEANDVLEWQPAGIMLSNGPGDPGAMAFEVEQVRKWVERQVPLFGICLGHQILALSQGLKTTKMFNGHRGVNHPVLNLLTGKCEITSQNHGFVVDRQGLESSDFAYETHRHVNDGTVAGLALKNSPAFSVQFHPEAAAGPHDSRYLFDQFLSMVKEMRVERNEIK